MRKKDGLRIDTVLRGIHIQTRTEGRVGRAGRDRRGGYGVIGLKKHARKTVDSEVRQGSGIGHCRTTQGELINREARHAHQPRRLSPISPITARLSLYYRPNVKLESSQKSEEQIIGLIFTFPSHKIANNRRAGAKILHLPLTRRRAKTCSSSAGAIEEMSFAGCTRADIVRSSTFLSRNKREGCATNKTMRISCRSHA